MCRTASVKAQPESLTGGVEGLCVSRPVGEPSILKVQGLELS